MAVSDDNNAVVDRRARSGAFADSSSCASVIERLQASGAQVLAGANPQRGVSTLITVSVGADAGAHPQTPTSDPPGARRARHTATEATVGDTTQEATMSTTQVGSNDATGSRRGTFEPICAGTRSARPWFYFATPTRKVEP
jgi:hypothetical protein